MCRKTNTVGDQLRDFARETSNPEFFLRTTNLSNLNTEKYVFINWLIGNSYHEYVIESQCESHCDCKMIKE